MSSPSALELVLKVLWVARKECEEQQEDLHYKAIWKKMASLGVYLQLQTRYHDQLSPRYIGENQESPGLNWSNCEGEYKFLNKTELEKFLTIDGMPTAARALLYTMTGKHEICEYPPVWMAFTGIIDADFGPPSPRPIRLQSVLRPLKFWENLEHAYFSPEGRLVDAHAELTAEFCEPFRKLALDIVHDAPHMLKPGYMVTRKARQRIKRFSWARLIVLLFLPEVVLMKELEQAGLANNLPAGWYQKARNDMRLAIRGTKRLADASVINEHWENICRDLDALHVTNTVWKHTFRDRTVRSTSSPSSIASEESAQDVTFCPDVESYTVGN